MITVLFPNCNTEKSRGKKKGKRVGGDKGQPLFKSFKVNNKTFVIE